MSLDVEFMKTTFLHALTGIPTTLGMTFLSLIIASPFAFLMALGRMKEVRIARSIISLYVSFIRGTPMVLQILIIYSLIPSSLNILIKKLGLPLNIFDVPPILYAYIVFSLNSIATLTECFRSALGTVDKGQMEAARAVGLTGVQAYRRIILPQALVAALPNLCNITVNLIKGTSLAFLMTVKDITAIAKMDAAYGYNYIEAYLVIFVIYIIVCTAIQMISGGIESYFGSYKEPKKGGLSCWK